MFIPRGSPLHENLATSYVLVDRLVADLCEGGFSGVVEVTLRDMDAQVIIARGRVAASLMARRREDSEAAGEVARATVAQIAAAARTERGRVSVYRYSDENAAAIGGRATAEALYTRLSTEFADMEKVVAKLSRERDREWFIEFTMSDGLAALVQFKDDRCRVLTARDGTLRETYESAMASENAALDALLEECHVRVGVFDVYFRGAAEALAGEAFIEAAGDATRDAAAPGDISEVVKEAKAVFQSLSLDETAAAADQPRAPRTLPVTPEAASALRELTGTLGEPVKHTDAPFAAISDDALLEMGDAATEPGRHDAARPTDDLLLVPDDLSATGLLKRGSEAVAFAEIKRLMGEIIRTVEASTRAAGSRDSFTMHLRAGQLKVADRYPFLDPFGSEFEYLAGEIVFVGQASAEQFIVGLSEALAQAIDNAARASAQPERIRVHTVEGLRWLLDRQRHELEPYLLDQAIEAIIEEVGSRQ
ncbi:MAG TPA: hypothetical protein VKA60_19575 [Blastocatellia bacterium]|nr:hypothetical protein [Blastocatellia bacterium]